MNAKNRTLPLNLLVLSSTVALCLFVAEFAVRISGISPGYDYPPGLFVEDEILGFKMAKDFDGVFVKQEFETSIDTNSLGLRDAEILKKRDDDYRILALGDSFAWGAYGTELNETYLKILEQRLNNMDSNTKFRVINAGVPGYSTKQEIAYLKEYGTALDADMVLLNFFVGNDFLNNAENKEYLVKNGMLTTNSSQQNMLTKTRGFLLLHLHSYRILEKGLINAFGNIIDRYIRGKLQQDGYQALLFEVPPSEQIQHEFNVTLDLLDEMYAFAKENDMELVIVVIPLKYQVDPHLERQFIEQNYDEMATYDLLQPQAVIGQWAEENSVMAIDLAPELRKMNANNDFYWKLNPHFNKQGNAAVAGIIIDKLKNSTRS